MRKSRWWFTDLVGFSEWALRAGDDAMLRLLRWVAQVVEPPLLEAGGPPCWRTSCPGHRAASTPSWRAGNPTELVPTLRRTNPNARSQGYALRPTNPNALSQVSTEELLLELRRRIIASRDQTPRDLGRLGRP